MPSGPEWFIVLAVVLVIFGGSQLPKLARNLGKAQKEFKDGLADGQAESDADKIAARKEEEARRALEEAAAARRAADAAAGRTDSPAPISPVEPKSD